MYFLSFETSTKIFSLAVNKDEKVLRYRNLKSASLLEDSIIPVVDKVLDSAGIKFTQIEGFAIALGPGSFTSLRVGLATVKAFAMATGRPVVGIPSLDIIAHGALSLSFHVSLVGGLNPPGSPYDEICVINDARRGRVYACLYDLKGPSLHQTPPQSSSQTRAIVRPPIPGTPLSRKSDYLLASLDDVLEKVHGRTLFVGDALRDYHNAIEERYQKYAAKKNSTCKCLFADEKWWYPQAKVMAALAYERFRNKMHDDAAGLSPLYLYPQDCQVTSPLDSKGSKEKTA